MGKTQSSGTTEINGLPLQMHFLIYKEEKIAFDGSVFWMGYLIFDGSVFLKVIRDKSVVLSS